MSRFATIVSSARSATVENVTRRAARAAGERRDDSGDESDASAQPDNDSDDDEVPYNPKNLPLGWDGKVRSLEMRLFYDPKIFVATSYSQRSLFSLCSHF